MVKREVVKDGKVKLTFVQPVDESKPVVFVLGDFNQWSPGATKLVKRANGTASASVMVDAGQKLRFRYLSSEGIWFNDEAADNYEKGTAGDEDCVLIL